MTIYYSLTFFLLAAEMVTFCLLVAPLPYAIKKRLFKFLSESFIVAKIAYGLKISFIFVGILFADALQRMFRVSAESDRIKSGQQVQDHRSETSIAARKFYAQRNVYLTGFCLFLSLVLTRTFYIILDLIHTQEENAKLKKASTTSSRTSGAAASEEQAKEITSLKKQLEQGKKDYDILKKQAAQNFAAYDELATEMNELTGNKSDKRKD